MFNDRKDAGLQLADALDAYKDHDVVVLGIPRGGIEVAYYVAINLNAELSMIVTRKLAEPEDPEAAFGALAEDGSVYLAAGATTIFTKKEINRIMDQERREIQRRIQTLRKGKPLPRLEGKTVIIVDDGIATGATLLCAIEMCRKKHPRKLVVATPIASPRMESELRKITDDVVILEKPDLFYAVGQGYRHFSNLSDEQTIWFMDEWRIRLKSA